jgi:hypothetical protein
VIVHFIGSKSGIERQIGYYRLIIKTLRSEGHTLATDWVERVYQDTRAGKTQDPRTDWAKIDHENSAAISKADVIVAEATEKSFFVGYQVAQAVSQKKPVLILVHSDALQGLVELTKTSDFLSGAKYTPETVKGILDKFIAENTVDVKDMRFNFFIDRPIYNYLRWASFKTGKTKAEVIRELIEREINKQDY